MRYITIPQPAKLDATTRDGQPTTVELSLADLIRKTLITKVKVDEDAMAKFTEIEAGVRDLKTGNVWELENKNHEYLLSLASSFEFGGEFKLAIFPLLRAITSAPSTDPRPKAELKMNGVGATVSAPVQAEA